MSRYVVLKQQGVFGSRYDWTATGADKPSACGCKLIAFSDPINRNPQTEEALDTKSISFVAAGIFKTGGNLEGYYRSGAGINNIIMGIMGSAESTWTSITTSLYGDAAKYDSDPYEVPAPHALTLTSTNCYKYALGSSIPSFTMRLVEDGTGSDKCSEYQDVILQNLEMTFDTRRFTYFRVGWLGGAVITKPIAADADNVPDFDEAMKPSVFYNMVIELGSGGIACTAMTLRVAKQLNENYFVLGSPFLAGAALNGPTQITGSITLGPSEYAHFASAYTFAGGPIHKDRNQMVDSSFRISFFDPDFNFIGLFNAGKIVFTDTNRNVQGQQQIERTINFMCYGQDEDFYFVVPKLVGTTGSASYAALQTTGGTTGFGFAGIVTGVDATGGITHVQITNSGSNYTSAPTILLYSSGGGSTGAITAALGTAGLSSAYRDKVVSLTITTAGTGYSVGDILYVAVA
jgi:hypothetical protein